MLKVTQPVTSLCIITFQKSFVDLKSTQNIMLKYLGLYAKHSLHTCKCSFGYFLLPLPVGRGRVINSPPSVFCMSPKHTI